MFTCGGIIIVIKIIKNIKSLPLNFNLTNAYPAQAEMIICPIVVIVATKKLLKKYFVKGNELKTLK